MKRLGMIVMAGLLVLGLAQCKKEQTNNTQSEGNVVRITLNVGPSTGSGTNNGSRVNVDPDAMEQVTFASGDQIVVASNGAVVGTLEHNGTNFTGDITSPTECYTEWRPTALFLLPWQQARNGCQRHRRIDREHQRPNDRGWLARDFDGTIHGELFHC